MRRSVLLTTVVGTVCVLMLIVAIFSWPRNRDRGPTIGVIVAETGDASFIGGPEGKLIRAWAGQHPYRNKIVLDIRDSGGAVDRAEAIFREFINDPTVIAVIGPSTSGESIPLAKLARDNKLPLLSLAASKKIVEDLEDADGVNDYVFKFAQNDDLAVRRLVNAMLARGHNKIALLHSDDGFGKSGGIVAEETFKEEPGVQLIFVRSFPEYMTTPGSHLAAIPKEADAVLIWGTSPGPALLLKALRRDNSDLPVYLSHGNASHAFVAEAGSASEGVVLVGSRVLLPASDLDPSNPADSVVIGYKEFWQRHFSGPPSHFAGHARDALEAMVAVLEKKHQTSRDDVRRDLEQLSRFHGVTGTFQFKPNDHAGLDLSAFETYSIRNGDFERFQGQR